MHVRMPIRKITSSRTFIATTAVFAPSGDANASATVRADAHAFAQTLVQVLFGMWCSMQCFTFSKSKGLQVHT